MFGSANTPDEYVIVGIEPERVEVVPEVVVLDDVVERSPRGRCASQPPPDRAPSAIQEAGEAGAARGLQLHRAELDHGGEVRRVELAHYVAVGQPDGPERRDPAQQSRVMQHDPSVRPRDRGPILTAGTARQLNGETARADPATQQIDERDVERLDRPTHATSWFVDKRGRTCGSTVTSCAGGAPRRR